MALRWKPVKDNKNLLEKGYLNQSLSDPERLFKRLEKVNAFNVKGADCRKNNRICIALYVGHTGNEKHLRQRNRVQKSFSVCVQWSVGGRPKAFTRWTAASTPLASKSRGGGRGWFQLLTAVPTGVLRPTLLHCLFFTSVYLTVPKAPL